MTDRIQIYGFGTALGTDGFSIGTARDALHWIEFADGVFREMNELGKPIETRYRPGT
jgi:hypothetical protein